MNAPLFESLGLENLSISDTTRIACFIVLNAELSHLKKTLGYNLLGPRTDGEKDGGQRPSWARFCTINAGVSEMTFRNHCRAALTVKNRLRASGQPDAERVLELLELQPSTLSQEIRAGLVMDIARLALSPADRLTDLKNQARAEAVPPQAGGFAEVPNKETAPPSKIETEAFAIACGCDRETARAAAEICEAAELAKLIKFAKACGVRPDRARKVAEIVRREEAERADRLAFMARMGPRVVKIWREQYGQPNNTNNP
jgi:hypothetical protein